VSPDAQSIPQNAPVQVDGASYYGISVAGQRWTVGQSVSHAQTAVDQARMGIQQAGSVWVGSVLYHTVSDVSVLGFKVAQMHRYRLVHAHRLIPIVPLVLVVGLLLILGYIVYEQLAGNRNAALFMKDLCGFLGVGCALKTVTQTWLGVSLIAAGGSLLAVYLATRAGPNGGVGMKPLEVGPELPKQPRFPKVGLEGSVAGKLGRVGLNVGG
jgi:hypothetical protein